MTARRISVRSSAGSYSVIYGEGQIRRVAASVKSLGPNTGVYLLISPRVGRYWQAKVERGLRGANLRATVEFDDRESAKRASNSSSIGLPPTRAACTSCQN